MECYECGRETNRVFEDESDHIYCEECWNKLHETDEEE